MADCIAVYDAIKEEIKSTKGVLSVRMLMCSTCCDFKIQVTMDADVYGEWKEGGHKPEEAFLQALMEVEGVDSAEAQLYSIHEV